MKKQFRAIPGKGVVTSSLVSAKSSIKCNDAIASINKETPESAFEMMSDMYDDIDEFCYDYYGMPAEDIKYIYSIHDGTNEDDCVETMDGAYYMFYSGHGSEPVTREEMIAHFSA